MYECYFSAKLERLKVDCDGKSRPSFAVLTFDHPCISFKSLAYDQTSDILSMVRYLVVWKIRVWVSKREDRGKTYKTFRRSSGDVRMDCTGAMLTRFVK